MKSKMKLSVDIIMSLCLLGAMGYQFWGEFAHEVLGAAAFALFIVHHLLNGSWHKNLCNGRYTPERILMLAVDLALLVFMLMQAYSAAVMSRYLFPWLPSLGGLSLARKLHILGANWGFVLTALHLGLHWAGIMSRLGKSGRKSIRICFVIALIIAVYGAFAFVQRDFPGNLFAQNEFVFLDYEEPFALFYLDYLAVCGLFIFLAHYGKKLLRNKKGAA